MVERSAHVPPGWPAEVHPPDTEGFERTASAWLLDLCPPDYRAHDVVVRHPLVLAVLAGHHVAAQVQGQRRAVATLRTDLAATVGTGVVERVLDVLGAEQARLMAASRGVTLLTEALRGLRHRPRW